MGAGLRDVPGELLLQITLEHVVACRVYDRVQNGVEHAQRREQKEHVALHNCHLINRLECTN